MSKNKDIYYFNHDSKARNDLNMLKLRIDLGLEGYGIFFCLIEMLREMKNYTLPFDVNVLAYDLRVDPGKIKRVIENYGLFEIDEGVFYSKFLKEQMLQREKVCLKRVEAGRKGGVNKHKAKGKQKGSKKKSLKRVKEKSFESKFEEIWTTYPSKDGKKAALRHFNASVKTEKDLSSIKQALENYLAHLKAEGWKRPKNGSTWFNNWQDWVEWKEQGKKVNDNDDWDKGKLRTKEFLRERRRVNGGN